MVDFRHLNNAPITEALIDFRVKFTEDLDLAKLKKLKAELQEKFPIGTERHVLSSSFNIFEGKPTVKPWEDIGIDGYALKSQDNKAVVQISKTGFTYSRLKPYLDWEDLLRHTKEFWSKYINITNPEKIIRVAVRYINHIKIPLPINDFGDYLENPPIVSTDIPQELSSFLFKVTVHDAKERISANIIQALERNVDPDFVNIILDIDAFKNVQLNIDSPDIWQMLDQLRILKNRIFFGSITSKTLELFD